MAVRTMSLACSPRDWATRLTWPHISSEIRTVRAGVAGWLGTA